MTDWIQLTKIVTAFIKADRPGLGLVAFLAVVLTTAATIALAILSN